MTHIRTNMGHSKKSFSASIDAGCFLSYALGRNLTVFERMDTYANPPALY